MKNLNEMTDEQLIKLIEKAQSILNERGNNYFSDIEEIK